jgi:hypothetical protein
MTNLGFLLLARAMGGAPYLVPDVREAPGEDGKVPGA